MASTIVESEFSGHKHARRIATGQTDNTHQQVWLLKSRLDLRIGAERRQLTAGDCIAITTEGVVTHWNPTKAEARYLIAVASFAVSAASHPGQPR
jgi:hypothetical protein